MLTRQPSLTRTAVAAILILSGAASCTMGQDGGAGAAAGSVVLVADGKAQGAIVSAEGLSPSERWAVEELQKFIEQMSGARLPALTFAEADASKQRALILVGNKTARKAHPDIKLDGLGEEGFVIKTVGDFIY